MIAGNWYLKVAMRRRLITLSFKIIIFDEVVEIEVNIQFFET